MKNLFWAAAAASLSVPTATLADGHKPPAGGGVGTQGGPPPAVISQMSLGQAGLLPSFYSNAQFGITRARRGEDNVRLGFAGASGITTGFEHSSKQLVTVLMGRKLLAGGSSYLTFSVGTNNKSDDPNLVEFDTSIPSVTIGYQNFARPDLAFAAHLSYGSRETTDGAVTTSRDEIGFRFDVAKKISDNWGVTGRLFYSTGDLTVETPGGTTVTPETMLYTQAELVGNFAPAGLNGWVVNPTLGVSYDIDTFETAAPEDEKKSGSVWAKATFVKPARPGGWSPNFTLGIEQVYENSTDDFIDDDTFAIIGVGVTRIDKRGNTLNASFERRQGSNGNRVNNVFVVGYAHNF